MRYQLGHPLLGNSMEYGEEERYIPDGYIQCKCGVVVPHYIKDEDICQDCYADRQDHIFEQDERSGK